jgi:spermidine/putrescine transport system ATP-binding protein
MASPATVRVDPVPAQQHDQPLLSIRGVGKRFRDVVALHEVDLDIRRGEFFTLLGPSGCGKTTLLRIIGGFERPSDGSIRLDGRELGAAPPESRPSNMVFQSYALFPHMTVWENVAYGLRTAGVDRDAVARRVSGALEMVGLEPLAARSVRALSGGQQQRVALVRALVNEPEVLLLDEPLGALDLQLRKRMQEELRAIQARLGTTFIYVTHDQQEALSMSHRVALMNHGRVIQLGTPREVYHAPQTRFVAEFVGDASLLPGEVRSADGGTVKVRLDCSGATRSFRHHGAAKLSPGDHVFVALRPEHLEVVQRSGPLAEGTLLRTIFLGDTSRHEVRLNSGDVVQVRASAHDATHVGASVAVDTAPGGGVAVRDDEAAVPEPAGAE